MESTRTCCSGLNCCGIRVEKGCFIFAIVNAVIVSACLVGCLYYICWIIDVEVNLARRKTVDAREVHIVEELLMICIILSICTVISFVHAVLLCYGVYKKIPGFLMAYFVFGVTVEILSVVGTITFFVLCYDIPDGKIYRALLSSAVLIVCVVYAFLLDIVHRTYVVFSNNAVLSSGHRLLNSYPVL